MPKKVTPKFQAENKTLLPQYQFCNYFLTLQKYYANKCTIFKF